MSNVFYGKIDNDHYGFDLTPARMGDNYVEITSEEHFKLIDSGMNIVPDENGYPKLVPYPEPTEEEKAQTEINLISPKSTDVRIEIGAANIYIPANEIGVLTSIIKELTSNV